MTHPSPTTPSPEFAAARAVREADEQRLEDARRKAAAAVHEAAHGLSAAVRVATGLGLKVDVEVDVLRTIGTPDAPVLSVKVYHPL